MMQNYRNESSFDEDRRDAESSIAQFKAAKELIKNNDFACSIEISGLKVGISNNMNLDAVFTAEIEEAEKFLRGEPNTWE